ncbi:MAG: amidohydrolase family protein [Anaerolineales bacterium]|nr:amidohydrolase family protein [Anaerolineales bacterium]
MTQGSSSSTVIDVHSHLYPRFYLELLEGRSEVPRVVRRNGELEFQIFQEEVGENAGGRTLSADFWDLQLKLDFMDAHGIDRSLVSLGNPWLGPFPGDDGDRVARRLNEEFSRYEAETDGRVVGIGVLPAGSVEAACREIEWIDSSPGLYGAVSGPRLAGLQLDDPGLEPVWKDLAERELPLFIHPEIGIEGDALKGYRHALPIGIGFPAETTIALTRLVFGGVLKRWPNLQLLVAHGGGCIPYLAGRLDAVWKSDSSLRENLPDPPSRYFRRLFLDALVYHPPAMRAAHSMIGSGRLLFGSDHPFSIADAGQNMSTIKQEFRENGDGEMILADSAKRFFGLRD